MSGHRVLVLATGGTIAGVADSQRGYVSGQIAADALIGPVAPALPDVTITTEQIASVGSQDMSEDIWFKLDQRIHTAASNGEADGIVIIHGTDTLEETAFFLDLVLLAEIPVVLVSAMRPAGALGADGPANLASGIRLAASSEARSRGVLVVSGNRIFAARDVFKARSFGVDAFDGFPEGAIGFASSSEVVFTSPAVPAKWCAPLTPPSVPRLPKVAIVLAHAGMQSDIVQAVLSVDVAGVVLAGLGHGTAPQPVLQTLADASKRGVAVVRASRCTQSRVLRNLEVGDDAAGFLPAGTLSPPKCRVLLQLLLSGEHSHLAREWARMAF